MNEDQDLQSTEESVNEIMEALPAAVRHYIGQGLYIGVTKNLARIHALTPDQATLLERKTLLMLIGVYTPDELIQSLFEEGNISEETVGAMAQEINDQIFVPLSAQIEQVNGGAAQVPAPEEKLFMPTGMRPVMPPIQPEVPALSVTPPPPPPPRPPQAAVPSYIPDYPIGTYAPPPQSPSYPQGFVKRSDSTPRFTPTPAPRPAPTPAPQPAPAVQPQVASTPLGPILPGSLPPTPAPMSAPTAGPVGPLQPRPPMPSMPQSVPMPAPKPYSVDPYREPVEEDK